MPTAPREVNIHVSSGTIIKGILFILLVGLLFILRDLVLIVLTAVVIASAVEPAVQWFAKYRIPRVLGVLLVYLIVILLFAGIFYFFLPPVLDEAVGFLATFPEYLDALTVQAPLTNIPFLGDETAGQEFALVDLISSFKSSITSASEGFVRTVSAVFGGLLSFVLIIVFSFYFAVQERNVTDFLRVITPVKHEVYVLDLWRRSRAKIGRWMQGQLVLALIIGVLVYLGLTVLGVRYALLLAILAALFELIPVFGPILAAIPAVLVAFIDGGATLALLAVGLFVIIQQFENHLIYPLVVTKVVGVPPLLVILALIVGAQLAGFLGILLSVPAAAVIQEFVHDLQKKKHAEVNTSKV